MRVSRACARGEVCAKEVGPPLAASSDSASVAKACPAAPPVPGAGGAWALTVSDDRCRRALLPLLQGDAWRARELELTFEVPALQAQLRAVQEGLRKEGLAALSVRYVGAGLVLSGKATDAEHRLAAPWSLQTVRRGALRSRTASSHARFSSMVRREGRAEVRAGSRRRGPCHAAPFQRVKVPSG